MKKISIVFLLAMTIGLCANEPEKPKKSVWAEADFSNWLKCERQYFDWEATTLDEKIHREFFLAYVHYCHDNLDHAHDGFRRVDEILSQEIKK